jgi:hypothetical protein
VAYFKLLSRHSVIGQSLDRLSHDGLKKRAAPEFLTEEEEWSE